VFIVTSLKRKNRSLQKDIKSLLLNKCVEYVDRRIFTIQNAIDEAMLSANDDTKSSAGDKHETGRAMAQLEQEKNSRQLQEALDLKNILLKIDPDKRSTIVSLGSIVITNRGNFYIAIAAGNIVIDDQQFFAISAVSPIAIKLKQAVLNEEFEFNGLSYKIKKII
jgi:hypothetical protein